MINMVEEKELLGYSTMEQIVLIGAGLAALGDFDSIENKVIPEFSRLFDEEHMRLPTQGIFPLLKAGLESEIVAIREYTATVLSTFFKKSPYWGTKHDELFKGAEEVAYNPNESARVRYHATVAILSAISAHSFHLKSYLPLVRSNFWQLQRNLNEGKNALGVPENEVKPYLEQLRFL